MPLYIATFILVKKKTETGPAGFGHVELITVEQVPFPPASQSLRYLHICCECLKAAMRTQTVCASKTWGFLNSIAVGIGIKMGENSACCKTLLAFKVDTGIQWCGNDQPCPGSMFQK